MASPLKHYDVSGTGLCIIVANFVGDQGNCLQGYKKDIEKIVKFFSSLNFISIIKKNQSSQQLREFLESLAVYFDGKSFDRLFVFVLSHGDKSGLCMCKERSGIITFEMCKSRKVTITSDEIISYFTHDKLRSLKGIPKCFFFQACRGQNYPQAAPPSDEEMIKQSMCHFDEVPKVMESHRFPTRADVFIAYATLEDSVAFVPKETGSSFISTLIETMENFSRRNDICQIMTRVIEKASGERHKTFFHCNSLNYDIRVCNDSKKLCPFRISGELKPEGCDARNDSSGSTSTDESDTDSDESESGDEKPGSVGDKTESGDDKPDSDRNNAESGSGKPGNGCGKIEVNPKIYPKPLYVGKKGDKWSYMGFILQEPVIMDEAIHRLDGKLYLKEDGLTCELVTIRDLNYEKLSSFKDNRYFTVDGTLSEKASGRVLAVGDICVEQDRLKVKERIFTLDENIPVHNLQLSVMMEGEMLSISKIEGKQGWLFINDVYYGTGTIEEERDGEVFGIYTEMFQVPTFTSTLTKPLYITEPTDDKTILRKAEESMTNLLKMVSGHTDYDTGPSDEVIITNPVEDVRPEESKKDVNTL